MDKILVAYDFSESANKAIVMAIKIAEKFNAHITILHVVEPEPDFVGFHAGPKVVQDQVTKEFHSEHKQLQSAATKFKAEYPNISAILAQGSTVETIVAHAEKHDIDLIIVGSKNKTRISAILLGSTSEGLSKYAKTSLLICH